MFDPQRLTIGVEDRTFWLFVVGGQDGRLLARVPFGTQVDQTQNLPSWQIFLVELSQSLSLANSAIKRQVHAHANTKHAHEHLFHLEDL